MLPPYLILVLSLALPCQCVPLSVIPRPVRFLTNFPTSLPPSTRMTLEWEGERPVEGWEVTVQPDMEGYEPLMTVEYVAVGQNASDAIWTTPANDDWPSSTKFIICVYGEQDQEKWFDCSPALKLASTKEPTKGETPQPKMATHRAQKPVQIVKRSFGLPSPRSRLAQAQKSHKLTRAQRLRQRLGLGGAIPLDRNQLGEMSRVLGYGVEGVPSGMLAFP